MGFEYRVLRGLLFSVGRMVADRSPCALPFWESVRFSRCGCCARVSRERPSSTRSEKIFDAPIRLGARLVVASRGSAGPG